MPLYTPPAGTNNVQSINGSSGTFSFNTASSLSSSRVGNAITFGLASNISTALQTAGAYLTTARASTDAIGLNTALTANGLSVTANSSGLSINVPAWLTTAMQSASSSVFAKTGFTTASTVGTDIVGTHDTNGLSMGIPKYLTTAQPTGAYLTTARASNDAVGLNTAATNVTWTVNSSGISINAGAYLTTAMASNRGSDFVQATAAFAGTNATGTIASNGISVSVANPSAGVGIAAGTRSATTAGNLLFDNANGITFGLNGNGSSIMTASHNAITTGALSNHSHGNPTLALTNLTGTTASASNGFTLSLSGNPAGGGAAITYSGTQLYRLGLMTPVFTNGQLWVNPIQIQNVQFDRAIFPINNTNSSNSSGSHSLTFRIGIYTLNASTLSLLQSASRTTALTHSGTVGSYSLFSGIRMMSVGLTTTLTQGEYFLAFNSSFATAGANGSYSIFLQSAIASNILGHFGVAADNTFQTSLGMGTYTAATNGMPGSIGVSQISGNGSVAFRQPVINFVSGTI